MDDRKALLPYLRQSRGKAGESEDTALSLEQQEESIKAWGERNGFHVLRAIKDWDETGRTMLRPGFEQLKAAAQPGVTIACWKYDRFARNLIGQEQAVAELEGIGAQVISITEPPGKLPRQIMGSIAEYYSDQLSERLTAIRSLSARNGRYTGVVPPYGYRRAGTIPIYDRTTGTMRDRPSGPLVIVEEYAEIVREVYQRIRDGDAIHPMTRDLLSRGIRTTNGYAFSATSLRKLVRNPLYMGKTTYRGEIAGDGLHEAIVTPELWYAANDRLDRNPRVRRKSPNQQTSWAEGYVRHACGARMYHTVYAHYKDGVKLPYLVYVCRFANGIHACGVGHKVVKADKVEAAIRRCLTVDLAEVATLEEAVADAERNAGGIDVQRQRSDLERQRIRADDRLARAREEWLDEGDDRDAWESEKQRHADLIAAIDRQLFALPVAPDPMRYRAAGEAMADAAMLCATMRDDDLRVILDAVGVLTVGPAGMSIAYHEVYQSFVRSPLVIGW